MKKILLIHPSTNWKNITLPMGLFYLASFLEKQPAVKEVEILNLPTEIGVPANDQGLSDYKAKLTRILESREFDIVGISCWVSDLYLSSILTAEMVRSIHKDAIIVVGGYHPSVIPTDFQFKNSPFDYIISGEGELPFKNHVLNGSLQEKPVIIENKVPIDLELLTDVNWDLLRNLELSNTSLGIIYLSRGCNYNCSFCLEKVKSNFRWRALSPKSSVEFIKSQIQAFPQIEIISISDPLFGLKKDWRQKFFDLLEKEEFNQSFFASTRIDTVNKEDLIKMAKFNLTPYSGVDSFSKKILLIMKKTGDPNSFLQRLKKISNISEEIQLKWITNTIFGHPGETIETLGETDQFLQENFKNKEFWIPTTNFYFHYPGSYVTAHLKEFEEKYGTHIGYPEWWKIQPMYQNFLEQYACKNKPSRNLTFKQLKKLTRSIIKNIRRLKSEFINPEFQKKVKTALQKYYTLMKDKNLLNGRGLNQFIDELGIERYEMILI
ncbi:MAG: B12-binding domain-containing radical SAM protein [Candidatus Helarchaeota archaeon]